MDEKKKIDFIVQHKLFWLGLVVVAFLPLVGLVILETSFDPGFQPIALVKEGGFLQIEGKDIKGLAMVKISFQEEVRSSSFKMEEDESISFSGLAYSKFKLYSDDQSLSQKISEVVLDFDLKEEELAALGLAATDLALFYQGEEISFQKQNIVKQKGYLYYQATAPNLGEFVLGQKAKEKVTKKVESAPTVSQEKEAELPEEITGEEFPAEGEAPEEQAPLPLAGEAIEQTPPPKKGFFTKIKDFFSRLFS